jgi:autotransporter-associated beta strand protein
LRALFNTAPTLTGGIRSGWATVNGSDWATYDAANGVQALAAYTPFAAAGASDNALLNAAGATTAGPTAVNSLKIAPPDSVSSLNLPAALTVATGGVLQTGGRAFTVASPLAAGPAADLAVHTDAGSTLTLAGGVTAAGLNKSGPGTLILNSNAALAPGGTSTSVNVNDGVLRLVGDDRLPANTIVMVNSAAAVGLDLNNTNQTIGNLQGTGNVAAGTGTLTLTGALARATPLTGTLSGSGALVKSSASGTSSTQLAGDNPFTGTVTVTGGPLHLAGVNATAAAVSVGQVGQTAATLQLLGPGTLAAASSNPVTVNAGGTLALRNDLLNLTTSSATPTASNRADRVADGRPIRVGGGTIAFTGHGHPWVDATETLGAVTFNPGGATVRNTAVSGGGASVLTFAGLTRDAGSAVNFTTTVGTLGTAGANPRVLVTSGLGAGFLPWATVNGTAFAFYNGDGATANANGVQALTAAAQTAFASAGAADHALLGGAGSVGAPRSVTSLQINSTGTGQSLGLGANNLAIASGGLLKTGTQDYGITGTGTLGQAGTELIVHVAGTAAPPAGPVLTVAAPIAANGLTKAGAGVLSLTANNSYAGPTTVAAGSLQVLNPIGSAGDSATGAGAVNTFVGTVLMGGDAAGTAGQIAGPVSVGGALRPGTSAAPGILTVRNDVTFSPDRTGVFSALLGGNAAGTEYSQLRVIGGDVVLNGALLSASFGGTPNAPLTIIDVTGGTVSGLFTNPGGQSLDDGAVFATFNGVPWFIDYTPTSVVVAPVPEPAGLLAVGAAGALAVGWLRRRARRAGRLS